MSHGGASFTYKGKGSTCKIERINVGIWGPRFHDIRSERKSVLSTFLAASRLRDRSPSLARKDAGAKRRGKEEVAGTQRRENVLKHPACSLHLPWREVRHLRRWRRMVADVEARLNLEQRLGEARAVRAKWKRGIPRERKKGERVRQKRKQEGGREVYTPREATSTPG